METTPIDVLAEDRKLKQELKRRFPQPPGILPVGASVADLLWEQHGAISLITEISTIYNPKTMALIKDLCKDSEPE